MPSTHVTPPWSSVFTGDLERPFHSSDWDVTLLTQDLYMPRLRWQWLEATLRHHHEDSIIASSLAGLNATRLSWDHSSLDDALAPLRPTLMAHDDVYLYSDSRHWGLICTNSDFSVLGGHPALVTMFAELAGGRQRLREEFLAWVRVGPWFVPSNLTEKLLALAGWN